MSKDNGGPAFPWCGDLNECPTFNLGMSLRDYFAAKAMQSGAIEIFQAPEFEAIQAIPLFAKACYQLADAMLAERAK